MRNNKSYKSYQRSISSTALFFHTDSQHGKEVVALSRPTTNTFSKKNNEGRRSLAVRYVSPKHKTDSVTNMASNMKLTMPEVAINEAELKSKKQRYAGY